MSDHIFLNLSNELGKSDKIRGSPSILLLSPNEFKEFNNTGAQILDYDFIYHMPLRFFEISFLAEKTLCTQHCYERHFIYVTLPGNL